MAEACSNSYCLGRNVTLEGNVCPRCGNVFCPKCNSRQYHIHAVSGIKTCLDCGYHDHKLVTIGVESET